ncbi:O-antigen ligase family protein [Patescibacteria group bacterium]|nr:O-antigen ligase family protein [Patescibacteria group bacterium]
MVNAKKNKLIFLQEKIVFLYLALFPFGQLLRTEITLFDKQIVLHPTDIVVGLTIPFFIFGFLKTHKIYKNISGFLLVAVFSLLVSLVFTDVVSVLSGSFYLLRFFAYSTFFLLVWNLVSGNASYRITLFNVLISVTVFVGLFGWVQYFFAVDLTTLKILGWDDHMYRLVGTFLDPGFTSIILVLGFVAGLVKFLYKKQKSLLLILVFLLISIAFTYARAAYLALFTGIFANIFFQRRSAAILLMAVFFLGLIPFLPRPYGEGVKLERTHSIYAKYENYIETFEIVKKQPLFGVGFNNMCFARMRYLENADSDSHACSGSDSSLLFVLTTTGIVGLIIFINMSLRILKSVGTDIYSKAFLSCSSALFVHSLFVHSLFYPWVMGWMGILLAISIENHSNA